MSKVVNLRKNAPRALGDQSAPEPISVEQTVAWLDEQVGQNDADLERALDAQAQADELADAQDEDEPGDDTPVAAPGEPPMSVAELRLRARITHRPDAKPIHVDDIAADLDCVLDRRGKPTEDYRGTAYNASLIMMNDARTHGALSMDLFTGNVRVNRSVDFKSKVIARIHSHPDGENFWDDHEAAIKSWLGSPRWAGGWGLRLTAEEMGNAVRNTAYQNARHPIYEKITESPWDGVPRLDTALSRWLRLDPRNDAYNRQVSRWTFVAALARIIEPGHKFDFVPVLQGLPQGTAKSTFIETLALGHYGEVSEPKEFSDTKILMEQTAGCWFVELPELSALIGVNPKAIKSKMSSRKDRARGAYSKYREDRQRNFLFFGTTNEVFFLHDPTGNRRFWPLALSVSEEDPINLTAVSEELQQVYAEALCVYREMRAQQADGDLPLFLTGEAAVIAKRVQMDASVETPEQTFAGWMKDWAEHELPAGEKFCGKQIWDSYHKFFRGDDQSPPYNRAEQMQVSTAIGLVPEIVPIHPDPKKAKARFRDYGEQRAYVFKPLGPVSEDPVAAAVPAPAAPADQDACPF